MSGTETQKNKDIVTVDISYEQINDDINKVSSQKYKIDVNSFLGQLFNVLEVGRNAQKIINPNLDYVVKFTPELLKKMEEHDVQFLRDKVTGELLPDLYDYTAKGIGGKVRLELKGKPTGQDMANLNMAVNNLIEQQRYEALAEELQNLHIVAKRIERGQDNDRFAKVNAGRKHLLDALNYKGTETEKQMMVLKALAMLREGRELIEKTLVDRLDALEEVPENIFLRLWKCASIKDYYDSNVNRYNDVQEYFKYYYMSIQPMAYAYTYLGQPHLIEKLLEDSKKVFEHNKLECMSTVEYMLSCDVPEKCWYRNPKEYEQKLLEAYKYREDEGVYITVKGSEILEVLENGE